MVIFLASPAYAHHHIDREAYEYSGKCLKQINQDTEETAYICPSLCGKQSNSVRVLPGPEGVGATIQIPDQNIKGNLAAVHVLPTTKKGRAMLVRVSRRNGRCDVSWCGCFSWLCDWRGTSRKTHCQRA
mmetsp:Transcript_116961/g.203065  ORF Transcript_116961/g.203065 Transcript_116961/m.203065 type:complete len:129 (-) Transcript_116961:62-448(-)